MNPWDDFWGRVDDAVGKRDGEALKKLFVGADVPAKSLGNSLNGAKAQDSGDNGPPPPPGTHNN